MQDLIKNVIEQSTGYNALPDEIVSGSAVYQTILTGFRWRRRMDWPESDWDKYLDWLVNPEKDQHNGETFWEYDIGSASEFI